MKVTAKKNLLFNKTFYKKGETFEVDGYAFNWLAKDGWVDKSGEKINPADEPDDGLIAPEGLPPLDEEPSKNRAKKNV